MYRDRAHEVREIAAVPTLERMRRDREKLPPQLSRLMTYLVNHLFDLKLSMTPLWLGGTAMFRPMAISIIFGLAFATMLTLLVVPVLYAALFLVGYKDYQAT